MRTLAVAVALALLFAFAPAASPAASTVGYPTFHPRKNVVAKQIAPKRIKFVNKTPRCVALSVTQKKGAYTYRSTHRLYYTHQKDKLWVKARVVKVKVYKPGC